MQFEMICQMGQSQESREMFCKQLDVDVEEFSVCLGNCWQIDAKFYDCPQMMYRQYWIPAQEGLQRDMELAPFDLKG